MTLCQYAHDQFNRLRLWFQPTTTEHRYKLRASEPIVFTILRLPPDTFITLTTTDPQIALPSPDYLRIHAACANVAHLSGAAEYFEAIWTDYEERRVLASDGGSADMLSLMLARAQVTAH